MSLRATARKGLWGPCCPHCRCRNSLPDPAGYRATGHVWLFRSALTEMECAGQPSPGLSRILTRPGHFSGARSACGCHPGCCRSRTFPSLREVLLHGLPATMAALPSRISGHRLHPGPTCEHRPTPPPAPGSVSGTGPVSTKGLANVSGATSGLFSFPFPSVPCSHSSPWQQPCSLVPGPNHRGVRLVGDVAPLWPGMFCPVAWAWHRKQGEARKEPSELARVSLVLWRPVRAVNALELVLPRKRLE